MILSDICCAAHTFCIRRIYVYSNCSVHWLFFKRYTVILFLLVSLANEKCELFLHHFTQKLGRFLQLAGTFCHRKNLYSLQLLRTSFICSKYTAVLFLLVSYTNETCGLFLHCFTQNLGRFLLFPCTFCLRENLFVLYSCSIYCSFVKNTLPLVNFTKEMCGLFLYRLIQSLYLW